MKTIQNNVEMLLRNKPDTRKNDHLMYVQYMEDIIQVPFTRENFLKYLQSFEGISRARRKVQELNPELVDKVTQEKREEKQGEYVAFYGNFFVNH